MIYQDMTYNFKGHFYLKIGMNTYTYSTVETYFFLDRVCFGKGKLGEEKKNIF